jgi:hypothetical protein
MSKRNETTKRESKTEKVQRSEEERSETMKTWLQWLFGQVREIAPYFAVELILPGGTLIALALWWYRRRSAAAQAAGVAR